MSGEPELSIAVPLYNEERNVDKVAIGLARAFDEAGIDYELLLVDNGSSDGTGPRVDELARANPRLRPLHLSPNRGYGGGIRAGLAAARGRCLGYTWGDDQVRPADHVRVYRQLAADGADLAKACRVERHDGFRRLVITRAYNTLFPWFFGVPCGDINGCPKILRREAFARLRIESEDWFIDPEIMIQAHRLGLRVASVPVVFHPREQGRSNVNWRTVIEFLRNMALYRLRGARGRAGRGAG
jgi:glycosyltransferase involved in cell wall biosynthesis